MTTRSKKPSRPVNTFTIDLDRTRSLYHEDLDGGTIAIDPLGDRKVILGEAEASEIADAAALGAAFSGILPAALRDDTDHGGVRELVLTRFPDGGYSVRRAVANVASAFAALSDKDFKKLRERAKGLIRLAEQDAALRAAE